MKKAAVKSEKSSVAVAEKEHGHNLGHNHGDECGCGHDHGLMCDIRVRQYKPADYRELKSVWKAGEIKVDSTDGAKAIQENFKRFKDSYRIFIAEAQMVDPKGNKPVGPARIAGGVITTFDGHRAYVYHLAVHPDFRSVGLGKALLETCEHQAKIWKAPYLRLSARRDASRAAARKMYEKAGWKADESIFIYCKTLDV